MIQIAIPALAVLVALVLYVKRPTAYVSYVLWVWFLAPIVRRLIDWQLGWNGQSLILLSPHFVTAVGILAALIPSSERKSARIPPSLLLCGAAVFYGFIVGMYLNPSAETLLGTLVWAVPLMIATYLVLDWERYEANRDVIMKTFTWGAGIMGIYGIYQFFVAPPWDVFWLQNVNLGLIDPSFGQPEPMLMRVWSTSNAPGPFAGIMVYALLFLTITPSRFKVPLGAAGYITFLLTVVRAAWLGWALGLVLLLRKARPQVLVRVVATLVILTACILPVLQMPELAPIIGDRFKTMSNIQSDGSFQERQDMYKVVLGVIVNDPFGQGTGAGGVVHNLAVDSGILGTLLSLGWLGTLLYLVGVTVFMFQSRAPDNSDIFIIACRAACFASIAQYIGGNVFIGLGGTMFWICGGGAMAGSLWHRSQAELMVVEPKPELEFAGA